MKRHIVTLFTLCAVFLSAMAAYGSGGFTGDGAADANSNADSGRFKAVTVKEAKSMPDDALVSLKGNIVRSLGGEKYMFRDATGEIAAEIDKEIWKGLSVGSGDLVEITGEIDIERRKAEIDVISIKKI